MQFTDLQELNSIIDFMRTTPGSETRSKTNRTWSPTTPRTFHDRNNSTVDALFNSSPANSEDGDSGDEIVRREITVAKRRESRNPSTAVNGKRPSQSQKKREKSVCKTVTFTKNKAKDPQPVDEFSKVEVLPEARNQDSQLSQILRACGLAAAPPSLALLIYLPDRTPMEIKVGEHSTVNEAIMGIVAQAVEGGLGGVKPQPGRYELRMHEDDGYPDEDFPALERSRRLHHFGTGAFHEYCLVLLPESQANGGAAAAGGGNTKTFIKIHMPNGMHCMVLLTPGLTGRGTLSILNKSHRLPLSSSDMYVLQVGEADRLRLKRASVEISMATRVDTLGVEELTLVKKTFADSPVMPSRRTSIGQDSDAAAAAAAAAMQRPDLSSFLFNELTAAVFQEWEVIKTNKWGRRQQRVMGMDLTKIYNRKVSENINKRGTSVRKSERRICDVVSVDFMEDMGPSMFRITYRESGVELSLDYETVNGAHDAAEIVAKLRYIMSLDSRSDATL